MDNQHLSLDETPGDGFRQHLRALDQRLRHVEASVMALREQFNHALAAVQHVQESLPGSTTTPHGQASCPIGPTPELTGMHNADAQPVQAVQGGESCESVKADATRFARVLVSEIELYNTAEVARGRENRDLYARLGPQIERGRKAYDHRFGKPVNAGADYFHEELVRALAQGDPTLLGSGYPYNSYNSK